LGIWCHRADAARARLSIPKGKRAVKSTQRYQPTRASGQSSILRHIASWWAETSSSEQVARPGSSVCANPRVFQSQFGHWTHGDPVYLDTAYGSRCRIDLENRWGEGTNQQENGLDVDSTGGTAIGTSDGKMGGDLNEYLISSVMWDLMDPIGDPIFELHDQIDGSYSATLGSFSRYVPMDGRQDRGPADPDFVDFLDGWRCYSPEVPDSKLKDLLDERKFPYDFATGLCRR
jgi:hypothetical protein